jgi:hypothetical protein
MQRVLNSGYQLWLITFAPKSTGIAGVSPKVAAHVFRP